jgi:hypothetical protein
MTNKGIVFLLAAKLKWRRMTDKRRGHKDRNVSVVLDMGMMIK